MSMDLIYSLQRRTPKSPPNLNCLNGTISLCTISSNNLIAFTTVTELDDTTNKTWGSHVYIADLNTPWNPHKIHSNWAHVTSLEWDLPGKLLLVCDVSGEFKVFQSCNYIVNQWNCIYTASFKGEHILAAAFFHNGKKVSLISEKKDNSLYNEKFGHLRFACSVRGFGRKPAEGALVVTATGLLGAVLFPKPIVSAESGPVLASITTDSLGATRKHVTAVDICYGKNGHFLIAVSGGSVAHPIQCYRVSVAKVDDNCIITSQALPSFFISVINNESLNVTHLRWVTREDADSLVVGAVNNTMNNSVLQVWELHETDLPVHHLLGSGTETPSFKTVLWQHQSQFTYHSQLASLTTSKFCISNAVPPSSYVIVAMNDNTIHCLYRDMLKQVCTVTVNIPRSDDSNLRLSHIDTSWLGNILLAVDTYGQSYLFKLQPVNEITGSSLTVPGIVTMLEYCVVSGFDCLDLLLACSVSRNTSSTTLLETVCERLTETFNRQLSATQQFYYVQFLYIRTALYRLTSQGQSKASDLTNLLMLHSIATAFKSLLRPSDMSSHDKSPADSLAAVMTETQTDVDKVLMHLEAKEFTVEPSTLQSLQQLIQWVADLALSLLARLPNSPSSSMQKNTSNYELLKDVKALNTLRELLVIIRIWGLLRPACLPVFVRSSESHDTLAHVFRLLSHLAQNPQEPDDSLIDECCQLPSQVTIPQFNHNGSRIALATPLLHQQNFPLQFEYGNEPEFLCYSGGSENPLYSIGSQKQIVDCIRHAWLGKAPRKVRVCARCGGRARAPFSQSVTPHQTTSRALRAWEQRWLTSCKCGGPWSVSTVY
ncbi:mediator of RNA polymerase II transcription subunit 16 [Chrysoperla carnea]|uniref:mediator of RNA polymerase II transcription subunit 16 n=1 Tax=Chrysoperla carnea TaxID=189513 RepID=UPI001D067D78|nr:mediator of RNA polymerase II transcription subunit 16 [Chrysoperla carnea]